VVSRLRAGLRRHGVVPPPPELSQLLRSADVRMTAGNRLELYRDGRSGLESMLREMSVARRRVHLETYILRGDATGRRFLEVLAQKAREGVEVRLLHDAVGSRGLDPNVFASLRSAGGDVVVFNPLRRLYPQWAPRRRDHRKILVVDGEVGFTGGLNIGDEYLEGPGPRGGEPVPWRDAHVRVVGPAVQLLEAVFLESWFRADGPDAPWGILAEPASAPRRGSESVGLIVDGPTYHRRRMRDVLIGALQSTERRARLVTPYFVPGRSLRAELAAAASRGVAVEVLIAGRIDHPVVRWAAHAWLPWLLERGVRVFEYHHSMMHAKVAVFDERWAIIGSSNLDRQSLQHSYEVNLVVREGELPGRLSRIFAEDVAGGVELTVSGLADRPWWRRVRDQVAAFALSHW
jgi:cardiolipin synthase